MGIYTNVNSEMVCPLCGDTNTHVDRMAMAARPNGEDGTIVEITVPADGDVIRGGRDIPPSRHVGLGRRHRIALYGWCESCNGEFALLFTQHKGVTLVESVGLGEHMSTAREGDAA